MNLTVFSRMAILAKAAFAVRESERGNIRMARMFESVLAKADGRVRAATEEQKTFGVKKSPLSEKTVRFILYVFA